VRRPPAEEAGGVIEDDGLIPDDDLTQDDEPPPSEHEHEHEDELEIAGGRLAHHGALPPREHRLWFTQLWDDACALRRRYRLPLRSGWWEDEIQVEALAALAEWVYRYDSGEWDDPPGKLALLAELERITVLLRDGGEPF